MWHRQPAFWHTACPGLTHPSDWQRAGGVASQKKKMPVGLATAAVVPGPPKSPELGVFRAPEAEAPGEQSGLALGL